MTDTTYRIIGIGHLVLRATELSDNRQLTPLKQQRIEELWTLAQNEKGGRLFNGDLFNFDSVEETAAGITILGHFVEYKQFIAHRKEPSLMLSIRPVGVSGILLLYTSKGVFLVFGKRAENMTQYPGGWELMPSGSIDKTFLKEDGIIDVSAKLEEELVEETGINIAHVQSIQPFALVYDSMEQCYDICCELKIQAEKEEFLTNMQKTSEYTGCEFVSLEKLDIFLEINRRAVIPTSIALIHSYLKWENRSL